MCTDTGRHEWFSKDFADAMIIAEKPYSGKHRLQISGILCRPADLKISGNRISFEDYKATKEIKERESEKLEITDKSISLKGLMMKGL